MPASWQGWKPAPKIAPQLGQTPSTGGSGLPPTPPPQPPPGPTTGPASNPPAQQYNPTQPSQPAQPTTGGGGAPAGLDLGPFGSYQQWHDQFVREHGREPDTTPHYTAAGVESNDYMDFQDSVNFWQKTGRAPTMREWKNRYYTGSWFGYSSGGGGWGGGGGGYGSSSGAAGNYAWNMPGTFWNW